MHGKLGGVEKKRTNTPAQVLDSASQVRQNVAMLGAALIAVVLLIVIPVSVIMSGGVLAGVIGFFVQKDVDELNEGSELIDLNG